MSYSSDEPHVVVGKPAGDAVLRIFLPGMGTRPKKASCLLGAVAGAHAAIGLSDLFRNSSDAERNAECASAHPESNEAVARCLFAQHAGALWGGELIPESGSISGRLRALLQHLHASAPLDGWGAFVRSDGGLAWERLVVGGHAEGAAHAAFIGQQVATAGVGLLSGPQTECIGCDASAGFWLDQPWKTRSVGAFASASEEAFDVIQANWRRMARVGVLASPPVDVGFGFAPPVGAMDVCVPRAPMIS